MAVRFDASSGGLGYLGRPAQVTGQPFTRIASFRFDDDDASNTLWNFDREDLAVWEYVEARSTNILRINTPGGTSDSASGVWTDATWHRFALVYSGNTRTVYRLDGGVVQLLQRTNAEQFAIADESLLGLWNEGAASGRAAAQEKVWAAALTVEELAHETQQFAPVRTANLVGWAKLLTHTDLSDEIGDSYTALGETSPSTVEGPTGIVEEWEGPRVASSATTKATSSSGGLSINLPSGIATGDLLLAFSANDTSVSWSASAGWEKIDDGANGSAVQGACWARIATGSDALTITGEANDIAVVTLRIPAAQHGVTDVTTIAKGTAATGTSNAPNGPNCNPGTSGKYLWITYYSADDDDNKALWWPVEAAPVAQVESAQSSSSCMVGVAYRWLEASSYDPSAFALSASEEWRAQTFAIPAAAGGSTGTLAAAESGADTAAIAGDVLIDGALAATESGSDTAALAGDVLVTGALAATESGADTADIAGTAAVVITGSLATTESGSDTAALAGDVLVEGALAAAESGADTAAIAGQAPVTGSLAATESGTDTAVIVGDVLVSGTLAATESGADVAAIQGTAQQVSTGSLAATESGADTASIAGTVLVEGALAATESGSDTAAIAGDVPVSGTLAATESWADTAALAGDVYISGALAATESGSDTAAIEGSLAVIATGSLAAMESGSDTASIAGVVLVSGSLAATEAANDSAAMSGVVLITGTLDATESGQDTAAISSAPPVTTAYPGPAGKSRGKRRRVVIRERVYEVSERDIPALIEAELLDRAPPVTAEVVAGPKPPRKRGKKARRSSSLRAPQPVKTVEQVRETVQQIKRRIEPDNAWLMQALESVAQRVLERLQDEEDSLMLLLAA